jgi:hypothetical protein
LSSPLLVTNAHDGSNRIFIVEQTGMIKVLQPGATAPTVFLDLTSKIICCGEQGVLGLTFHPRFWSNKRFFVDYARAGDGATVISEFHVSSNPNVADPNSERILLTVPQPFSNHNGGMIEFGPDGFMYIAKGDGGSANDPGNRAQNPAELHGKILRIDVDHTNGSIPYAIPPTNPFFGSTTAAQEVYALGMRNPWRFSFDRLTGKLYCGDVGQDAWEEADIITLGANYGWRIWEGNHCTNIDPCVSTGKTFPILEYQHLSGRCAIIGGYVYRGTLSTLAQGLYVYGDLCTGEILTFDGTNQTVALSSGKSPHSFGEDESGEIYMADGGGGVFKLQSSPSCTFSLDHQSASFGIGGGSGSIQVTDMGGCSWSSMSNASWITVNSGGSGSTSGTLNYTVAANNSGVNRLGTISVAGTVVRITQSGPPNFEGFVDHSGCDFIGGWAADTNQLNTPITVSLYDGTTLLETVMAGASRPDVGAFLGDNGMHGFTIATPASLKDGNMHSVHVQFETSTTDLSNSPASMTCTSSSPLYVGFIDHLGCDSMFGWVADRNRPSTPINVDVYDGTTLIGVVTANLSRADVGAFLGDNGLHGFTITTPASLLNGAMHSVHLKFETSTTELSGSPVSLTCTAVTPNYVGFADHVGCDSIFGWVADRNRLNTAITVSIYANGVLIATVQADDSRPDVGTFLGDNGNHGFVIPTPASLKGGKTTTINIRFEDSSMDVLSNSPFMLTCP